mmetsp:Transcript_22806/g.77660  ORF Transcript_22806/g.77660 Transcript_22806/m.77660 type:complete len:354 (+) Transcript_22806:41-1102(+)|eukprot:CAMPEP_0203867842 /NCGR_PEP_ID=MMETSP0359-20131031/16759_1 /ASSEMBLY_ACC=CAM_ASM_000338 /TAXON_ID=268821 /ORGANISM="Scrippsiella Hangoei, Strain SHTV-5" /LENGTH=353 /DNA_ID=CAMNT_0050786157 /DNA_START=41 /DNA_END=1102 /DNA_ORIENTATION=+
MSKRQTDPYMVEDGSDDDSEGSSASPKRARMSAGSLSGKGFSGGFGNAEGGGAADTAEAELEAMLAAEKQPAAGGGFSSGPAGMPTGLAPGAAAAASAAPMPSAAVPGAPQVVETTPMDFRSTRENLPVREVPVPKNLCEYLMTPEHRRILCEESGADVEWDPAATLVELRGSPEQVKKATRILQRVLMHCHWGRSTRKVSRLLRPVVVESSICRLSPMNSLRAVEKTLNIGSPMMTIGKDKANDVCIPDAILSRQHCVIELDPERGAVYAIDCSTNGTYLNGIRLPAKTVGKVLLSHGDELLFKDPAGGDAEFGYIVNLLEQVVRQHVKYDAPRRLLTPEEMSSGGRDFGMQ